MADIGTAFSAVTAISSLGVIWLMQTTTPEAGFYSSLGMLKMGHRIIMALAAIVLFWDAGYTLSTGTGPRWIDFVLVVALLAAVGLLAIRHRMCIKRRLAGNTKDCRDCGACPMG